MLRKVLGTQQKSAIIIIVSIFWGSVSHQGQLKRWGKRPPPAVRAPAYSLVSHSPHTGKALHVSRAKHLQKTSTSTLHLPILGSFWTTQSFLQKRTGFATPLFLRACWFNKTSSFVPTASSQPTCNIPQLEPHHLGVRPLEDLQSKIHWKYK